MIKKQMMKAAGIAAVLFTVAVIPATAKSLPKQQERNMQNPRIAESNMQNQMPPRGKGFMGKLELMGEITSIDESKQLLTVQDIDGASHVVHVNAFTAVCEFDQDSGDKDVEKPNSVKDFKKGQTVAVRSFETETKTIEASMILIEK